MPENSSRDGKILKFVRPVNGVSVEQRQLDGFINGTAMCVAHGKDISDWLKTDDTWDLMVALAENLGIKSKSHKSGNSVYKRVSASYPSLVAVKRGSPLVGGGTWVHPDLAIQLAQWCNKPFSIQVSRWVREWLLAGQNPIQATGENLDKEWQNWQQRYGFRIELKDFLRPELMSSVAQWAEQHGQSPISLCSQVHDTMNERIQGAKAKQIRLIGGLPLGALIRDYFGASPLSCYLAINQLAKNAINDTGVEPLQAVHDACDRYLGKTYVPKLVPLSENLYAQGRRLKAAKKYRQLAQGKQLSFWDFQGEAC